MKAKQKTDKTLQEAIVYFSNPDNALAYMVGRRWPNGVDCPTCGRKDVVFLKTQRKWQCKSVHPKRQFSAKVGTIFEDSPIALEKWMTAVWMLSNCRNGVSSYEIGRTIGVTQKSAWFMLHRIRLAMQRGSFMLGGDNKTVEVDETFIGGKARNMHRSRRRRVQVQNPENFGKSIVMGMLERGGKVKTQVIPHRKADVLRAAIMNNVEPFTTLCSDEWTAYKSVEQDYDHRVINHLESYVNGHVHTQGIENFWSLFKRGLSGTYVAVEPFHLFRYADEQAFRFNHRKDESGNKLTDAERFNIALDGVTGKRLTFADVTGKSVETPF
jgi:transposase-like protein